MHIGRFEAVDLDYDFEKRKEKQIVFRHYFQKRRKKKKKKKKQLKRKKVWPKHGVRTIFYHHDLLCHTVDASLISAQVKFACCGIDYWHQQNLLTVVLTTGTSKICSLWYWLLAPAKSAHCGIDYWHQQNLLTVVLTTGTSKICSLWYWLLAPAKSAHCGIDYWQHNIYIAPLLWALYECKIPGCQLPKSRMLPNNIWHKNPEQWLSDCYV